jgi:hypothetical protein
LFETSSFATADFGDAFATAVGDAIGVETEGLVAGGAVFTVAVLLVTGAVDLLLVVLSFEVFFECVAAFVVALVDAVAACACAYGAAASVIATNAPPASARIAVLIS